MQLGDARQGKLFNNLVGFGRALRRAGIPIDSARIALAQQCCDIIGFDNKEDVRAALQAVCVSRQTDLIVFNELFDAFFRNPEIAKQLMAQLLPQTKAPTAPKRSPRAQEALAAPAPTRKQAPLPPKEDEIKLDAAMSASAVQRLKQADFEKLSASEFKLVEKLAREIPLSLPHYRCRRFVHAKSGDRIHWAALLKQAARLDGEVIALSQKNRLTQPLPILILVDISGSMERYARLMLAFLHHATQHHKRAVYAFGTQLTNLNMAFKLADTDQMLTQTNRLIQDFGGGTQMGVSIGALRAQHKREIVARRTLVLIISDGLDTGDLHELESHLSWLSKQARQLIWLNPLLRYEGYTPTAGGARLLYEYVDKMVAIHNLDSLEKLAHALASVSPKPISSHRRVNQNLTKGTYHANARQ